MMANGGGDEVGGSCTDVDVEVGDGDVGADGWWDGGMMLNGGGDEVGGSWTDVDVEVGGGDVGGDVDVRGLIIGGRSSVGMVPKVRRGGRVCQKYSRRGIWAL
jgi:hypothetical protein